MGGGGVQATAQGKVARTAPPPSAKACLTVHNPNCSLDLRVMVVRLSASTYQGLFCCRTGTLMIEPTESESLFELDRFAEAMLMIREEIKEIEEGKAERDNNVLVNAPHTSKVLVGEWPYPYSREKAVFPTPWLRYLVFFCVFGILIPSGTCSKCGVIR